VCLPLNLTNSFLIILKKVDPWTIDGKEGKMWQVGLDSRFQKTPISTPKKRIVQPGNAIEDAAFKPGLEIVKF
jgi:hypothetical protein